MEKNNSENYNKIENELNNLYNKFSNSNYNELDEIKNKLNKLYNDLYNIDQ